MGRALSGGVRVDHYSPSKEPEGIVILGLPRKLLGPTERVFVGPTGPQTELMATYEVGDYWCNVPLLVPGQVGVANLLAGYPPIQTQVDYAIRWVKAQPSWPRYSTIEEARVALAERNARIAVELMPTIEAHLRTRYAGVLR